MIRAEKILNQSSRDATRIVSKKPSDNEGNNGDIVSGYVNGGPKVFIKNKNQWTTFVPKSSRRPSAFQGWADVPLRNTTAKHSGGGYTIHVAYGGGWLRLGSQDSQAFFPYRREEGADAPEQYYSSETNTLGMRNYYASEAKREGHIAISPNPYLSPWESCILMPEDATLEFFQVRSMHSGVGVHLEIWELKNGENDWNPTNAGEGEDVDWLIAASYNRLMHAIGTTTTQVDEQIVSNLDYKTWEDTDLASGHVFKMGSLVLIKLSTTGNTSNPWYDENDYEEYSETYADAAPPIVPAQLMFRHHFRYYPDGFGN